MAGRDCHCQCPMAALTIQCWGQEQKSLAFAFHRHRQLASSSAFRPVFLRCNMAAPICGAHLDSSNL
jgi:hypothetical protein